MKPEKRIFVAFILNAIFSVFELIGGIFTGSVAIISDAIHDMGDAGSIGISYILEKKSKKQPDEKYTYGYARYSVVGSAVMCIILLLGSIFVIYSSVRRMISPTEINYNGMIIFAVVGISVNLGATVITLRGNSLNQKAVSLHMMEDVLGWVVVLVGAIVMRFTDFYILDPIMSLGVSVFILISAVKNLKEALDIFLEKAPKNINAYEIREHLCGIEGVLDAHHIHIWSMDGHNSYATMHIVASAELSDVKKKVRAELMEHGIVHSVIELEEEGEPCDSLRCHATFNTSAGHCHHHH